MLTSLLRGAGFLLGSVADAIYPETCAGCGTAAHRTPWCQGGAVVRGLRPFDRPHLCCDCREELADPDGVRQDRLLATGENLVCLAAGPTTSLLAEVVGAWKYHGVRGLAWPLADLLVAVLSRAVSDGEDPGTLVPVPLHGRRRRRRGFNQAELLARLAGGPLGLPVDANLARRIRGTGQQAKLGGEAARWQNLSGSFTAKSPVPGSPRRLTLVDDVITSGATTGEMARVLRRAGWEVVMAASLGAGRPKGDSEGVSA